MDRVARRRLADENLLVRLELTRRYVGDPRGGTARFGAVEVLAIGVDAAYFNSVFVVDPASRAEDIVAGLDWIEERGLPAMVRISEELDARLRPAVEATGLTAHPSPMPVMALEPIPRILPAMPAEVEIRTGRGELFDDFHIALESGDVIRRVFGPELVADPDVRLVVAYLDGEPVSCGAAVRSGSTVGVYAVATIERARRRGIGGAVSWATIDAGRAAWGGTVAVLQSSEVGLSVYHSMGFEEVAGYYLYARPET